ncbi:hypothetical protein GCM10023148_22370 [Actinokineospora soli]
MAIMHASIEGNRSGRLRGGGGCRWDYRVLMGDTRGSRRAIPSMRNPSTAPASIHATGRWDGVRDGGGLHQSRLIGVSFLIGRVHS